MMEEFDIVIEIASLRVDVDLQLGSSEVDVDVALKETLLINPPYDLEYGSESLI